MLALIVKSDPLGAAFYADMPLYNALVVFSAQYGLHDLLVLSSPGGSADLRRYSFDRLLSKKQIAKILNINYENEFLQEQLKI